ncbi:glycoside hydrolase family 2 protein [Paenibacillus sp. BC26]|uniref:glycoside hydrolase family 2 protein n=1 Tax=Paenibacillus sp. BC26 TaxID=1881032 RepID=UPI0008F09E0C|nr:sugar-binding domain-containing protein [Paenibacillus sp. BC26]SFT03924.1 Glycosyl hydrolases family 2 [Paenibacillus sp. BC26]
MENVIPRKEYPRPQFEREQWLPLNGTWQFAFDDRNTGEKEKWYRDESCAFNQTIVVPYCFQSELSGIGDTSFHDVVWYRRGFLIPAAYTGKRMVLHFGAVDYAAKVWVNGELVMTHQGGHTPFSADITSVLIDGENMVVVRAEDYSQDVTLPRGKQYWKENSDIVFYTRTTGIWQSVWLEPVSELSLRRVRMTPDIDRNVVSIRSFIEGDMKGKYVELQTEVTFKGQPICRDRMDIVAEEEERLLKLNDFNDHGMGRWWTPEKPQLYDVKFTLVVDGEIMDEVKSYFGMRKISIVDGVFCLNNRPYYMKLILDQGYFPGGVLTAATDEALLEDIGYTKAMGFNGVRKHQKLEDPRYLYHCDRLGLLVWGEGANAYDYSEKYVSRFIQEWQEAIERDYNSPSLVVWVPINESWGIPNVLNDVRQQQHGLTMYHLTRSLDTTRPVISNDGWEHLKSDLFTIHDYEWRREVLQSRYETKEQTVVSNPQGRWLSVPGFQYGGEPILMSEFGGVSFMKSAAEGWGYSAAKDSQDFLERIVNIIHPILNNGVFQGYCYTQLTDVEQEKNGLLTFNREPKLPLEIIKQINAGINPKLPVQVN